ncbi:hypothetical protein HGM15179_014997 [Zosterops borbonicus]|uniref:Uncharacterized protein n=1 Tax=Zosterops borbonicus TaxID=364589 RepID=A0A8K1G5Z5_9PASS|nr:hypothetical protein HGM15179_014997 [Zosterops borbonicus]
MQTCCETRGCAVSWGNSAQSSTFHRTEDPRKFHRTVRGTVRDQVNASVLEKRLQRKSRNRRKPRSRCSLHALPQLRKQRKYRRNNAKFPRPAARGEWIVSRAQSDRSRAA